MAWCMQHCYCEGTQLERFAIGCHMYFKGRFRTGTIHDGSAGCLAQVDMATDEIGMEMRFEDILYRRVPFCSELEIRVYIAQRVNNSSFAIAFNIIRCLAQAAGVELPNKHNKSFLPAKIHCLQASGYLLRMACLL